MILWICPVWLLTRTGKRLNKLRRREGTWRAQPMKDNRGLTLIELIVVMLIISILGAGSIMGVNLLKAGSAKRAAQRIEAALSLTQTRNMLKGSSYTMEIKQDTTGDYILSVYYIDSTGVRKDESTETLNLKKGRITFENDRGEVFAVELTETTDVRLEVSFRRDTGGVKANASGDIVTRIGVTSSGSTRNIRLVTVTGKHYIE